MAKNTQLSNAAANPMGDALARLLDNGFLRIYDGLQPASGNVAITTQNLLCELRFAATSAPATAAGVTTFSAIAAATVAKSGTAAWFRAFKADGTTAVYDGTVDIVANTPNITVSSTSFVQGATCTVSSLTFTTTESDPGS
jgi:hypothetical protein